MDKESILKKASQVAFKKTNGVVLRTINVLSGDFNEIELVKDVLADEGIDLSEFMDAVNYLMISEYIQIRRIDTHEDADLADVSYKDCEARLTQKGVQVLKGFIKDVAVEV